MVDLPPDALHLIAAVVPNLDLDIAVGVSHARTMFHQTFLVEARRIGQESEAPLATWNSRTGVCTTGWRVTAARVALLLNPACLIRL